MTQIGAYWTNFHKILYYILHIFFIEGEIVQTKFVKKVNTHTLCSITFSENLAVYEIMQKDTVQPGRPQMTIPYDACAVHGG